MPSHLEAVSFDARDPARLAAFWADLLGRAVADDVPGPLLPGPDGEAGLRFLPGVARLGPGRAHLHLTSASHEEQQDTVAAALELGARHLDVGQLPDEGHVVLADPEGNAFCVIEPGNAFLAGCGRLGEVACDGTRQVGLFWAAALGWPLVWDRDQETAVQSPCGGTKIAWSGMPATPTLGRHQRLDLVLETDLQPEVDRLVALGATLLDSSGGAVQLSDPDGVEFRLVSR